MEEIDIKELLEFLKSKLYLFIFIVVFVCLLGCVYGLILQKPMYSSYTTVILSGTETTITQSDLTLNKNLVNTYAEVVKSRRVTILDSWFGREALHNMRWLRICLDIRCFPWGIRL